MEKNPSFKFPKALLNQIEECSNGGYTLFVFDSNGTPIIYSNSETVPHAYAMQYFMDNYVKGLEAQNIEMALNAIQNNGDEEEIS